MRVDAVDGGFMEMKHSAARLWFLVMFAMAAAITTGAENKPEKTADQDIGIIMIL